MKWFTCCHCKEEKPASEFYKDKQKTSGYKPRCKPCDKLSLNPERRKEYEKEYRQKNPELRSSYVKKSMEANKEHHAEQRRKYLQTPEGKAMYRKQTQTRYALRKNSFVEVVDINAVYDEQEGVCYLCQEEFAFDEMHADHVIPLSKGGLHKRSNIKMACASCNLSKGAKLLQEVTY